MIKNKFYIALAIIIIFIFFSSVVSAGCKAEGEKEGTEEEEVQAEEIVTEEAVASEENEAAEVNDISVEEVYEIINSGQDYIILDVRTPEEFSEGYIEGAVLIPVDELEDRLDELPVDKPIITYCKSGGRSSNAANILVENGFTLVYDMGGITDWIDKGYPVIIEEDTTEDNGINAMVQTITVDDAYKFFNDEDYIFLDVRAQSEYDYCQIQGAVNIPVNELESRLDELEKDKTIIAYCGGAECSMSGRAAQILISNGFNKVYDMIGGGINEWEEKGYPVTDTKK